MRNRMISFLYLCFIGTHLFAQQNTILIIADDVSPDYFGCFSTTTDTAVTPVIRSLADRGVKFTKVWAAPVCSPSRAGIFTGRYPFRTGVGQIITGASSPQLDTSEMSIAKLLKGYAPIKYNTACVGKWHLHANTIPQRLNPNRMGYDFYSGNFNGAISDYYSYPIIVNGQLDTANTYATTQTVNDAISWMDTMDIAKPFFLWLGFNAPHSPFHLPPSTLCNTSGLTGTTAHINANKEKYFKAALQALDTEIGRLFQYLTLHNLMDSTNIIFVGDNGNEKEVAQIANPNKAKQTIYDYGVRVPLIAAGPAIVNGNRTSSELINAPDIFATIAELCSFSNWRNSIPASTQMDSRSFLPILKNQLVSGRSWIFTEQFTSTPAAYDGKTIRNEDFHLLRFDNGNEEFYNQTNDPEENINLLLNTMSTLEIAQYHFLCDTITSLTGVGTCKPLSTATEFIEPRVTLYPNPSNEIIKVESDKEISKLVMYDLTGRCIKETYFSFLHTSDLSEGIYILSLFFKDGKRLNKKVELLH